MDLEDDLELLDQDVVLEQPACAFRQSSIVSMNSETAKGGQIAAVVLAIPQSKRLKSARWIDCEVRADITTEELNDEVDMPLAVLLFLVLFCSEVVAAGAGRLAAICPDKPQPDSCHTFSHAGSLEKH
jgi:hypothetical protein